MGYALPTSRKYLAWYMQQQRKKRAASEPTEVQRFFTQLNPTLTQYYTIPTWTASGDFEIEFDSYTTYTGTQIILGRSGVTNSYIAIMNTGAVRVSIEGALLSSADGVYDYTQMNKIKVVRIPDNSIEIHQNDTLIASGSINASFNLERIGRFSSGLYFDGIISNISLTESGGDNRSYALDEDLSTGSTIIDSIGGNNGTAISITESNKFIFDGIAYPNTYTMIDPPFESFNAYSPPPFSFNNTMNVVFDGNSLMNAGSSVFSSKSPINNVGVISANVAIDGQDWAGMDFADADVIAALEDRYNKTLILWEHTNCINSGYTVAASWTLFQNYLSARKADYPDARIIVLGTIPREGGNISANYPDVTSFNEALVELDTLTENNAATLGYTFVNVRTPTSPFNFSSYTIADFDAAGDVWVETTPNRTHLNTDGYNLVYDYLGPILDGLS